MSFYIQLIIGAVTGFLHNVIKNPQSAATEEIIIHDLALAATDADAAVSGGTWTYTPAPAPAKGK